MSQREAGKQKRRDAILAAAEDLLREHGGVDFSMRALAKRADVAFVTPFNLFGSKGGVIAALFEQKLDAQHGRLLPDMAEGSDPIERVFDLAIVGCRAYTADPELHRPLIRALSAIAAPDQSQLLAQATDLWRLSLRDAHAAGLIEPGRNLDMLASALHVAFRGALSLWTLGEIDAEQLERHLEGERAARAPRVA